MSEGKKKAGKSLILIIQRQLGSPTNAAKMICGIIRNVECKSVIKSSSKKLNEPARECALKIGNCQSMEPSLRRAIKTKSNSDKVVVVIIKAFAPTATHFYYS